MVSNSRMAPAPIPVPAAGECEPFRVGGPVDRLAAGSPVREFAAQVGDACLGRESRGFWTEVGGSVGATQ